MESAILKGAVASVEGHSPLETSRDGMDSSFPSGSWMPEGEASTRTIHTGRLPGTQEGGGEGTESGKSKKKPLAPGLSLRAGFEWRLCHFRVILETSSFTLRALLLPSWVAIPGCGRG